MTQEDVELIVKKLRATGLHASWNDLVSLTNNAIGSLIDALQKLLRNTSENTDLLNHEENQRLAIESLSKALVLFTSAEQVSRWKAEALVRS